MKLFTTLATTLVFTLPTLACLRVHGGITHDPLPGLSGIYGVEAIDNGLVVCSVGMGSRIDQDGHYSLGCLPGYVYAFKKDGSFAWYANPVNAFSFTQNAQSNTYCCHGACLDKGAKIDCTDYNWDETHFC
ncbi:hypothetical protein F5882DRAFT_397310 [Hyaloscypha sp. PMI_1271]|nr:hypothetical protein F5882DRAFT_397310 [Hyaloscypha sp. PMI_1271]